MSSLLSAGPSGEEAKLSPAGREAVVLFFQQIATMIPSLSWLGFSCELEVSASEDIGWEGAWQQDFRFSTEQGPLLALHARLSADFVSALERATESQKTDTKPPEASLRVARTPGRATQTWIC